MITIIKHLTLLVCILGILGCERSTERYNNNNRLSVIATTTIVGDVVRQVAGHDIAVDVLLPVGTSPHGYTPAPQDLIRASKAQIIFINGAGLETFVTEMLEKTGDVSRIVDLSQGLSLRELDNSKHQEDDPHHEHSVDPHVWLDPYNVMSWTRRISIELSRVDSLNRAQFEKRAANYIQDLHNLDQWIQEQIGSIPENKRQFISDHRIYGYFTARYGIQSVGDVIPAFSTLAGTSAQSLAQLYEIINASGVTVIILGNTANPIQAEQLAQDTGLQVIRIYTGSLSESAGPAASYLQYMQYNVIAMANALRQEPALDEDR